MPLLTENHKHIGTQKINIPKPFTVKLRNTSDKKVTALSINSVGCAACTSASLSTTFLAPGTETEMTVIYKPGFTGADVPRTVTIGYQIGGEEKTEVFTFKATSTN